MDKRYDVYAIGNALVDTEVEVSDAFLTKMQVEKGLMTLVDEARQAELTAALENTPAERAAGGSACNSIVAVCHFGGSAFYSCKVADDETGHFYVKDLTEAGADSNMKAPYPQGTSGKCLVLVTPDAERSMNSFLGISATISVDETDEAALAASRYLYLEGYLASSDTGRAAARHLHDKAKQLGVKTALTFSDAAMVEFFRDGLSTMLADGVDLLFCNEGEAESFTGESTAESALSALKKVAGHVVITLGAEGALIWDGTDTHKIDATPTKAIDSNGAGDMFAGAYLYGLTHGKNAKEAGELASRAAAQVVGQFGPRLSLAAHQELLKG